MVLADAVHGRLTCLLYATLLDCDLQCSTVISLLLFAALKGILGLQVSCYVVLKGCLVLSSL